MITSLSNKQKKQLNSPNYLIFSSANHNSNRSSANRSIKDLYPSIKSDQNESQRNEQKMFKIRTFGGKAISAKQPKIQGKRMAQEVISRIKEDTQMRVMKCGISNRRPSIQLAKQIKNENPYRSRKQASSIDSAIFKEIQIIPKQQRYQMKFQYVDYSEYAALSHRPNIYINSRKEKNEDMHELVFIFSMNFLNLDSKKIFKPRQRSYHSQRSAECDNQSPFSIDVQNILKNICGNNQKSFFNNCGIYFKVNSYSHLNQLRDLLDENGLTNYDGIIDVKGKMTQTHNIYEINQIVAEGQKLILLQQEQTLETDIPLIQNMETLFMTLKGKNLNYNNVNKTIKILKNIETQGERTRHTQDDSPTKAIIRFEDKQNLHPNNGMANIKLNRTLRQPKLTSNKKISKNQVTFYVNSAMKGLSFSFGQCILISKVHQVNKMKKIRHFLRQSKNSFRQKTNLPSSSIQKLHQANRNRSFDNKIRQANTSKQTSSFSIQLQGDFKEKLMKYVKIIDSQRAAQQQTSKELKNRQQIQSKDDDLEELTFDLTTRVKSKTPYQIVGDLIRNNTHIAKQVEKHMSKMNSIRKLLDVDEQPLVQIEQITQRIIYTFQL